MKAQGRCVLRAVKPVEPRPRAPGSLGRGGAGPTRARSGPIGYGFRGGASEGALRAFWGGAGALLRTAPVARTVMEETGGGFRKELVRRLLHLHFEDAKTRVSGDALQLVTELLKIFVVEAAIRGVRQAQAEDLARVDVDQLEKVLPQLESTLAATTCPGHSQSPCPHCLLGPRP
ncbi:centromere protein X isoform X1 [Manis javanica]|uniref:centromere protein X isoform X1 n=1 Tax=Manis javanica TaxID=9974 RepID=UPI003C6CEAEE